MIRAGDRDRLLVQDRLRDAYGQGALTTDELEDRLSLAMSARLLEDLRQLTADLPEPVDGSAVTFDPPAAHRTDTTVVEDDRGWWAQLVAWAAVVAVLLGGVSMLRNADVVSVFGSTVRQPAIDLSDGEVDELRVLVLFGSAEVVVQPGATADNGVVAIFGSAECELACAPDSDGVDLEIGGLTVFGSVEVTGG